MVNDRLVNIKKRWNFRQNRYSEMQIMTEKRQPYERLNDYII